MKTTIRFAWLAPLLALGITVRAVAQEPATATGAILILTNDRVLEGAIDKVGDQFRIRRGTGETLLAASRVKILCADWDEALTYQRTQANLGDPDERLRLARWCQQNNMKEQALIEAQAAIEMRPTHAESKQLLRMLERPATSPQQLATMVVKAPDAMPQLDLSADALGMFTTKVQPILMNTCAGCHANGQGGNFHLQRAFDGTARAATQRNIAAAVSQIKFDNPGASTLLVKAVSAHGTSVQPPLRDRRAIPFQALQQWVEQVAANNPHLRDTRVAAVAPRSSPETTAPVVSSPMNPVVSRPVLRPEEPKSTAPISTAFKAPAAAPQAPMASVPAVNPADPFDPAQFNRPSSPQR